LGERAIAVTTFDRQMIIKREMLTSRGSLPYSFDDQETDPRLQASKKSLSDTG
jgi:hypothetical protein